MKPMTLREWVEALSRQVEVMFKVKGEVAPHFLFIDREGALCYAPAPMTDKDTAASLMRSLFELKGATRCAFISEAWQVCALPGPGAERAKALARQNRLEEYEGRDEVLIFQDEDLAEGEVTASRPIIREPGKRPRLGPLDTREGFTQSSGRFVGMLPRPPGTKTQ